MSGETPLLPLYGVHMCNVTSEFTFVFRSSPRCCLHLAERCITASLAQNGLASMWQYKRNSLAAPSPVRDRCLIMA